MMVSISPFHEKTFISAFLSKEAFIATGVAIACLVDVVRLSVYSEKFALSNWIDNWQTLIVAILAALAGAFIGRKLLTKTKINTLYLFIAIALILFGLLLASGIIAKT